MGHGVAENQPGDATQQAGLILVVRLPVPKVAGRGVAVAEMKSPGVHAGTFDDGGIRADDQSARGAHAQGGNEPWEKGHELAVKTAASQALKGSRVNVPFLKNRGKGWGMSHQGVDGGPRKHQGELFKHFFPASHAQQPVVN